MEIDLPVREDILYTDAKGREKARLRKSKQRLLKKLVPALRSVLGSETILFATPAVAPYGFLEFWFFGWHIHFMKRSVLVFTDRRILHFFMKGKIPKTMLREIAYSTIEKWKVGMWGELTLWYRNRQKERFTMGRKDRKKVKTILPELLSTTGVVDATGPRHLCPQCLTPLEEKVYSCSSCDLTFKNPKTAIRKSILIPGGGFFYTNHPVLGGIDAVVELSLLFGLIFSIFPPVNFGRAIIFGIALALEKVFSIIQALALIRDYIPEKQVSIGSACR
jgi:hypothetical protein